MSSEPILEYVDLQVNGYVGVDFNDPRTSQAELLKAAVALRNDGVQSALPTVITGPIESMETCIGNLVRTIHEHQAAAEVFAGIHIEGPFLSRVPGFIGAHPVQDAKDQDLKLLDRLCRAGGNLVRLVTLAPEVDEQARMTRHCVERGMRVAAGHTDATLEQLECCLDAGLSLFTHLGNGCPMLLDRHDNIMMRALRLSDRLHYSLIADGFHIPEILFSNLLEWVDIDRLMVVSDAISAAGLGPGVYRLGAREVRIGSDKAARDASGEHFVGAASTMRDADYWLAHSLQLPVAVRRKLLVENPMRYLAGQKDGA